MSEINIADAKKKMPATIIMDSYRGVKTSFLPNMLLTVFASHQGNYGIIFY